MTFEDDFLKLDDIGFILCSKLNLEWPPPETVEFAGISFERIRYSQITDEQRAEMTHVARGAEYQKRLLEFVPITAAEALGA